MGNRERVFVSGMETKRGKNREGGGTDTGGQRAHVSLHHQLCVPELSFTANVSRPCATAVNL